MRVIVFILYLVSLAPLGANSQNWELIKEIEVKGLRFISTDVLGNIYTVDVNSVINKYDLNGNHKFVQSYKRMGELSQLDATNPLQLVLLYKDLNTVIIAENTLTEITRVDFQRLGFYQVTTACKSRQTGLWFYDVTDRRIRKVNGSNELLFSSDLLAEYVGMEPPNFMKEINNQVYLNVPDRGILVFDPFGTYMKTISVKGLTSFQVLGKSLYYTNEGRVMKYNLETLEENELILPAIAQKGQIKNLRISEDRMMVHTPNRLLVYRYK